MERSISKIISDYLYENKIAKAHVARLIGDSSQNFGKKLSLNDLPVSLVMRISIALKHDFFKDLSYEYEKVNNVQNKPPLAHYSLETLNEKIDILIQEISEIKHEKESEIKQLKKSKSVR